MQNRNQRRFAIVIVITILLLFGTVFVLSYPLTYQYETVHETERVVTENIWHQGGEIIGVIMISSTSSNYTLELSAHALSIPYFNVTPGPVSIVVATQNFVHLNISMVSGYLIDGLQPPSYNPDPSSQTSTYNITVHYEGVNSTVSFVYSQWMAYSQSITIRERWTSIVTMDLTNYFGGGLIVVGVIVLCTIRKSSSSSSSTK